MPEADGFTRSDLSGQGIRRVRCGRGFRYLDPESHRPDAATLARIKALVIPPAWQEVWICPDPCGHIQAIGTDSAGRRQYVYHESWRRRREADKHDRMLRFAVALPGIRKAVGEHLAGEEVTRSRVLAVAVRLLDLGFFRSGGDEYAEENGTFGLATIQRSHVRIAGNEIKFSYTAKGSKEREQSIVDDDVKGLIQVLKRRRGGTRLLAYRCGRRWHEITAADINDYLGELSGCEATAKDFRTWHATVLAAVGLAVSEYAAESEPAAKRATARVIREVADYLGNTPAVARASYIDPGIVDGYYNGKTIRQALSALGEDHKFGELASTGKAEEAVMRLLRSARPEHCPEQN
ncbi:MAG TPA: DNA topoisomerase IB [Streptosporangiaceae bacterium]|jgi:DNA topoisomerase IB